MKLPTPSRYFKKPSGKKAWALIAILALASLALLIGLLLMTRDEPDRPWAYEVIDHAQQISLSQAVSLLEQPDAKGRRAAVLGYNLIIEAQPGAADAPEELAAAYDARAEQLENSKAKTPASHPDTEISLGVVKATFAGYNSGFIDHLVATSSFDIEVIEDGIRQRDPFSMAVSIISIIILGSMVFVLFRMKNFGTSNSFNIVAPEDIDTRLDDVAGIGMAKADIEEVISLLKDPGKASSLGGRMPRGTLFDGPPGTGKTMLAKAVAKEAGVTFISVDASSLTALYIGLGAIKVRRLFRRARKLAPCVLFIDEIDALAKRRGATSGAGGDEKENTLNALLTELDGFEDRSGIFVIGATNRFDVLDPALVRPGRIDRRTTMTLPDIGGRQEILEAHLRNIPLDADVDLRALAASSYGFSGAQLANMINEAALNAGRLGRERVSQDDFRHGRDRILLPRGSAQVRLEEEDRALTAYHEAGHALIAALSPHADPVESVTILPRGATLGYVMQAPGRDFVLHSRARLIEKIRVAVAGRAAEELIYGDDFVTTGAASDIRQATQVARAMVTHYGMSELGFVEIDPNDPFFSARGATVLEHVHDIIMRQQAVVREMLDAHRTALIALAEALQVHETLTGEEVQEIVKKA